ncbi:hypothetical protein EDD18DRAFT_1127937 [Armillaria luteobubalina]|uniref:IBR domain-containing protein n=1 Tax=Armillaria luteobubalina TaxID=153913 RepID=A0AA39QNY6_9AGAR|nr:hypothetical protein EDD18DRAFT_1127937 [Armillaria luteobubalina]
MNQKFLVSNPAFMRTVHSVIPRMLRLLSRDVQLQGTSMPLLTRPSSLSTSSQHVICKDCFRAHCNFRAPCEVRYCHDCLKKLVQASIDDESLYPVRCCHDRPFVERDILPLHPSALLACFRIRCNNASHEPVKILSAWLSLVSQRVEMETGRIQHAG